MTQKEFESTKEWLEKVTGMEFSDYQARLDEDGTAIFEKYIDADKWVTLFIDDKESLLYLSGFRFIGFNPEQGSVNCVFYCFGVFGNITVRA